MELVVQNIQLVSSDDLAVALGFAAPNCAFRKFCMNIGITPVRRNPNYFDPKLVRERLDQAQGITGDSGAEKSESHVALRRARRGAAQ